ncbi:centromere protein U [Lacerta agilis]|uniref:centromere protein U n=1 Tax=Lacerta agilis TaxID=80427 RepID=UPI001419393B|nr:centromere protein U [Lacerta agilis]
MPKRKSKRDFRKKLGEPDVSSILKVLHTDQAEEPDELFDESSQEPLHSTAVSAYEEEDQYSDGSTSSSSDSEPKKKDTSGRYYRCKFENMFILVIHHVPIPHSLTHLKRNYLLIFKATCQNVLHYFIYFSRKRQHILKSRSEREDSEEEPVQENMRATESTSSTEDYRLTSPLPVRCSSSECRISDNIPDLVEDLNTDKRPIMSAECHKKRKEACSPEMETDYSDSDAEPDSIKVWGSKDMKKVASRVKETDVILDAFERITAKYKQGVELEICRKAIDSFSIAFREQLTDNVADAEELRTTKLKNAKMVRATNKRRQRLIEVKGELLKTEPRLKKLEREYAELKGELSTLRNAVQLVTDLKDLKQKYVNVRKENPQEKTVYGASSLPALLVESRRILGAESHVRHINSKLQQVLDSQTED